MGKFEIKIFQLPKPKKQISNKFKKKKINKKNLVVCKYMKNNNLDEKIKNLNN